VLCVEKPLRAEPVLVDRIVAVVEGRPVLLSEVRVLEQVAQLDAARALEALIDERLMYREAARLPQAAVSVAEEDRALQSLRARAPAAAALPERGLRLLARRQATIVADSAGSPMPASSSRYRVYRSVVSRLSVENTASGANSSVSTRTRVDHSAR